MRHCGSTRAGLASAARAGALVFTAVSVGCAAHQRQASVVPTPSALAQYIAKVRSASAPPPPKRPPVQTIEQLDPRLATALTALQVARSPANYRDVAAQYARLHIIDAADKYLTAAIEIDRDDPASYDARARLYRDAGFPGMGLGDAYRAWHLSSTAGTATTMGTLFEGMRQLTHAREWYRKALTLSPDAWYALNNICHLDTVEARRTAVTSCTRALAAAPGSAVAQNNLALAFAVAGDLDQAREHFAAAGGDTAAAYNMGIIFMAKRQYEDAATEFRAAWQASPSKRVADRLAQAMASQHITR
jgi:tetratricopeptide (TPR) repeat protein